jgi:hypothetical protein
MEKPGLKAKLLRDIAYLEQDQIPLEPSGLKIEKLDYEGESSGDEAYQLDDDDVMALSEALKKSNTFQGPLNLERNKLTDLVSYNIILIHKFICYSQLCT